VSLPLDDQFDAAAELEGAGSHGDALQAYDAIYRELEDETDLDSREAAAKALSLQAEILDALGHHEDELRLRELLVERERDAPEPRMRERVARTLVNIALTFRDLERPDDQLTTLDMVVEQYGHADERELATQVMRALSEKARLLKRRGRPEEALVVYDAIIDRDEAVGDSLVGTASGRAHFDKAACLAGLVRLEEAVGECRDALACFGESSRGTHEWIVRTQINEAIFLGRLGETVAALAIFSEILEEEDIDLDDDKLVEDVLRAAVYFAATVRNLGRPEQALLTLRETIDRVAAAPGEDARTWTGSTLSVYARTLGELGRSGQAIDAYDEAVEALEPADSLVRREWIADALIAKAALQRDRGDQDAAGETFRDVFDRFSDDPEGRLPQLSAWSGATAVQLLHRFRRAGEMRALCQAIVDRFGQSDDEAIQQIVWRAGVQVQGLAYRERMLRLFRLG
jgi:tetratricopeptide (TPR) repeat protein